MQAFLNFQTKQVDFCFYAALQKVIKTTTMFLTLCILQIIIMGGLLLSQLITKSPADDDIFSFEILAVALSFLGMSGHYSHLVFLKRKDFALVVANQFSHLVEYGEHVGRIVRGDDVPPNWVSTEVYNSQNGISVAEATPQLRAVTESPLQNVLTNVAMSMDGCNRFIINVSNGGSLAMLVMGIILLSTAPTTTGQKISIIMYLVLLFFTNLQFFLCLIFVCLLPLLCLVACVYICCFKEGERQANLPPVVQATAEMLSQAEAGDCSICFQSLMPGESVIVLPCSPKHLFHQTCIKTWTALKPYCPICRHDLSQ